MKLHKLFYSLTIIGNCDINDGREIGKHVRHALSQGLKNLIIIDVECEGVDSILPMTEEELDKLEQEEDSQD